MSRSIRKHCRAAVPILLMQALVRCSAREQMHALLHLPGEPRSNFFLYKAKLVGCAWQSFYVKQIQDGHLALQPTPICHLYAWPAHKHHPGVRPPHPALRTAEAARLSAQLPWHTSCRRTASPCRPHASVSLVLSGMMVKNLGQSVHSLGCKGRSALFERALSSSHPGSKESAMQQPHQQGCHRHRCACSAPSRYVLAPSQFLGRHSLTHSCPSQRTLTG